MTPFDYERFAADTLRAQAEDAGDARLRCDECGAVLQRGNVWPHDYLHCPLCGEFYDTDGDVILGADYDDANYDEERFDDY